MSQLISFSAVPENEDEEEDNPMYDYPPPDTWLTPSKPGTVQSMHVVYVRL